MSFRPPPGRAARDAGERMFLGDHLIVSGALDADERIFLGDHVVPNTFVKSNDVFDYTDFKTKQVFSMGET